LPKAIKLSAFALACFFLTLIPGGVWSAMLAANLRTGIALPWAVPVAAILLWLGWRYAGGHGPPDRTAEVRRRYRRANRVSGAVWRAALLANGFALLAFCGLWIVLFQLARSPGNPAIDFSKYPVLTIALIVATGALVGAVSEEVGMRGYLQGALERTFPAAIAIFLTALALAPGHALTQGFVWSTILFYLLVDIVYGVTALLTNSIYPGIVAHATGLLVFFLVIWPYDAGRRLVSMGWMDTWFRIHLMQAAVFGALAIWSFMRLSTLTTRSSAATAAAR
jgi:membrane protease YdiL (CAAX protease family)